MKIKKNDRIILASTISILPTNTLHIVRNETSLHIIRILYAAKWATNVKSRFSTFHIGI